MVFGSGNGLSKKGVKAVMFVSRAAVDIQKVKSRCVILMRNNLQKIMLYIDAVEVGVICSEVFLSKNCRIRPGQLFSLVDIITWEADWPVSFLEGNDFG